MELIWSVLFVAIFIVNLYAYVKVVYKCVRKVRIEKSKNISTKNGSIFNMAAMAVEDQHIGISINIKKYKQAPGPMPWPIIGNLVLLARYSTPFEGFSELAKQFGNVYSLTLGTTRCLIVNNLDLIREVLNQKGKYFGGRPNFLRYHMIFGGDRNNSLALCDWSQLQQKRRNLARKHCSPRYATSFYQKMSNVARCEIHEFVSRLNAAIGGKGEEIALKPLIQQTCANMFCQYMCSVRFDYDDKEFQTIVRCFDEIFWEINQGYAVDFLPWLSPFYSNHMKKIVCWSETIRKFILERIINDREENIDTEAPERDFTDALLKGLNENDDLSRDIIIYMLEDFIGGHSAVGNLVMLALAHLVKNPESVRKIQEEVAGILGQNQRYISLSDIETMPYTLSTIYEVLRYSSSPIVPHVATEDVVVGGYGVTKGTIVFINNYTLNTSPKYWSEPEKFKPDRFISTLNPPKIDPLSKKQQIIEIKKNIPHFLPFSIGKRTCIGQKLVQGFGFIILANIVYKYDICSRDLTKIKTYPACLAVPPDTFLLTLKPRFPLTISSNNCRRPTGGPKLIFDNVYSKRNVHHIWEGWGFVVIGVLLLLGYGCRYNLYENLPKALGNTDLLHNPHSFIAERAWKDLKILTNFGPRMVSTYSNEVLAVDFLRREVSYIKQLAHKNQRIELDVQIVSGAYWNGFKPYGMTSMYHNIQNLVVKLHGEHISNENEQNVNFKNKALLINCHFDTVPGSPGASDDAASCVVMIEILRVLSRSDRRLKHSIVFLFNGAEEAGLHASHGFISKHKWASEIKAFLNLESVGSGGKELLFQSNRNNSWLIQMYANSAPYPSAQVAAEEIFDSGLIPSDTDFRIFQHVGGLPGLDFAYFVNGQRYHTKFDSLDYLPNGSIQHTGYNILELTKALADSDKLGIVQPEFDGTSIYFDLFGIYFVAYSGDFATVFNYIVVICSVILPYIILSKATKGINKQHLRYEIFLGFLIKMISLVSSCACCYAIAYDLDITGKPMTWYSNVFLCVPTYCLATVFVQSIGHLIFNRNQKTPLSLALQAQARLIGTSFFWGILSAAATGAGIRTTYALVVPLLFTLMSNLVIGVFKLQNTIRLWLYIHLAGQVLVALWTLNFYNMVIDVFVSTSGRSGGKKNPDVIIAIICSTLTFLTTSFLTPLVILFKKCKNYLIILFAIYVITRFYLIAFTHYGFPYRDDTNGDPRVQRHFITHSIRTLYDKEGSIRYTDSGFWFLEMDRNARKTIESLTMPEEPIRQDSNILCKSEVFCGLPLLSPRQLVPGGFWVPGPAPVIREEGHLKLVLHEKLSSTEHRMHFMITGSHLMSLKIRPKQSVSLKSWNLTPYIPPETTYNNRKCYFVMITNGLDHESINITMSLKTSEKHFKRSLVDVTLVTTHFEHHKEHTSIFANLLSKLPRWAYAVPSVASLKSWTF